MYFWNILEAEMQNVLLELNRKYKSKIKCVKRPIHLLSSVHPDSLDVDRS